MDKDDINRNNNRNDPNRNNNNNTALSPNLSVDLWRLVLDRLGVEGDAVALVSRQLLQAWRSGVLGIRLWGCDLQDLNFLRSEFTGNRDTAQSFPNLRTLEIHDHQREEPGPLTVRPFYAGHAPQDLTLRLHLQTSKLVLDVLQLARSFPALAARVTHLQLGRRTALGNASADTHLATDYLAELIAAFPNLDHLIVVGTPSFNGATHELLTQRSALRRLKLADCQSLSTGCLQQLTTICPQVIELELERCALHDGNIWHLIAQWPSLRGLIVLSHRYAHEFIANAAMSDEDVQQLINAPLQLQLLVLGGYHHLTPDRLTQLGAAQPSLTHLELGGGQYRVGSMFGDEHLLALSAWPQLQYLHITGLASISGTGLQHLSQCVALTELVLGSDLGVKGDELVSSTPLFPNVKRLSFEKLPFECFTGSGFLNLLNHFPNITHFNGVALQGEDYDRDLADVIDRVQFRLQTTRAASGTPSLHINLHEFDPIDRLFVVRALQIILRDATEPVDVDLDFCPPTLSPDDTDDDTDDN